MKAFRPTLLVSAALVLSCSQSSDQPLPAIDVDAADASFYEPDTPEPDPPDAVTEPPEVVEIDLADYLSAPSGSPSVRAYELEGDAPFSGPVIQGRPGDWVIENDVARFLIEGDKRAMSPCPWGGTVIDAAYLADGTDEDILGEICMLVNGGLAFRPDRFDLLHDGTDGGAVVLATSGRLVINDFLNLRTMIDDFVEGLGDRIHIDVDEILPLRVTTYYVLRPEETNLHVLTAFRNDSEEQVDMFPIFPVASGGDGYYFNPLSSTGGFGSSGSALGVGLEDLPFIVFNGERASYAFAPEPRLQLENKPMPTAGSYIVISGVAANAIGAPVHRLLDVLTATEENLAEMEEVTHIPPHEIEVLEHRLYVGTGSIATMADPIYERVDMERATLRGVVNDTDGTPVAGARVTAMFEGFRTRNQTISDEDGNWSMIVPPGEYEIVARKGGMAPTGPTVVVAEADDELEVQGVTVSKAATIRVSVSTPDDGCDDTTGPQPVPARLTIVCEEDPCPSAPNSTEKDTTFHRKPSEFAAVEYGTVDGVVEAQVPPGDYRVVVSRGIEWSMWPADAVDTGGEAVTVEAGETLELDAEIARVVDTGGAYAGDFHIHSISSPDSPVPREARVRNFMAEGVDVMVSTDHDYIADYRPVIDDLTANAWIQAIVGEEVTTADLGHFNAFPLEQDLTHSRGGAIDWGGGESYTLLPADLFATIEEHPGEQVIQVNHAAGLGLIKSAKADVLRGITYADREEHRLEPGDPDPETGDTGIWSDDFTAMELLNGNSRGRFYRLGRWWMTMVGRGFTPTGTAVTDTHKLYSDLGGVPRTYVWGTGDKSCGSRRFDDLQDYDAFVADYAASINAGQAIGTNGPFVGVTVRNGADETATLGETITADSETVATLELQFPEWMRINEVDVYLNPPLEDVQTRPGEIIEDPIPPTDNVAVTLDAMTDLVTVTTGETDHRVWRKSVEIPLQSDEDAFVVFVVKGGTSMWPLVGTAPFAFTNPVYLDADGSGYDNPPYAAAAAQPPAPDDLPPCPDQFCGTREPADDDQLTPQEIIDAVRHLDCQHPAHAH
jgi:hypothetical protein